MSVTLVLVQVIAFSSFVFAKHVHEFEIDNKESEKTIAQALELMLSQSKGATGSRVQGFSFKDCGDSSWPAHLQSLTISPDPISFPGPLTVAADFTFKTELDAPLRAALKIEKKISIEWIEIPCIASFGSCTYDDVCQLLESVTQCPPQLVKSGIDCKCPFKNQAYHLNATTFDVQASIIPSGEYKIQANLTHNETPVGCLELQLSID